MLQKRGLLQVLRFYQEKCADIQKEADKVQATASRVGAEEHDDSSDNAADQVLSFSRYLHSL